MALKVSTNQRYYYFKVTLSCLPIILVAGLRDITIGTDTDSYPLLIFNSMRFVNNLTQAIQDQEILAEPLYTTLAYLTYQITHQFNAFLVACQVVITLFWIILFRKFRVPIIYSLFAFFCLFFNFSLNGVRQSIAMAIVPLAFYHFTEKKYIWTIFWLVIGYYSHNSSIIFSLSLVLYAAIERLPAMFVSWKTKILVLAAATLVFFSFSELLASLLDYGIIKAKYVELYGSDEVFEANLGISDLYVNVGHLFFIYYFAPKNKPSLYIFLEYLAIISVVLTFTSTISMFLVRITYYFQVLIVLLLIRFIDESKQKKWSLTAFYAIYWLATTFLNLGEINPYTSEILGI